MKINQVLPLPHFTFLWVVLGFSIGLCLGFEQFFSVKYPISLLTIPVFLLLVFLRTRQTLMGQLLIVVVFICLGHDYAVEKKETRSIQKWEMYYRTDRLYEGEIVQLSGENREWKKVILKVNSVYTEKEKIAQNISVLAYIKAEKGAFRRGDIVRLASDVIPIEGPKNPGEFNSKKYWGNKGIGQMTFANGDEIIKIGNDLSFLSRTLEDLDKQFSGLFDEYFEGQELGVLKALVLGDKDQLDAETLQSFSSSGAMHVLAVSGLHIGIFLNLLLRFFSLFPKFFSKYRGLWFALFILIVYAGITGFSPSVCRAELMFGLLAISKTWGREGTGLNTLCFSAFLLLIYDPYYFFDIGFQLSYVAMIGIFVFYHPIQKLFFFQNGLLQKSWQASALGVAATITTFPLTLYYFHQFPNYFMVSNLLLIYTAELVLMLGVILLFVQAVPFVNWLLAILMSWGAIAMIYSVRWVENLPFAVAYGFEVSGLLLFFLYCGIVVVFLLFYFQKKQYLVWSTLLCGTILLVLQSVRFINQQTDEIVVFSSKQTLVSVKIKDQIKVFYEGERSKVQRSISSYQQMKPGNIAYCQLENNRTYCLTAGDQLIVLHSKPENLEIYTDEKKISVLKSPKGYVEAAKSAEYIFPVWMKNGEIKGHYLYKGFYRWSLD